jgi:L-ascorbate metabolism protein UlaG (beta-lactamase superfamily)
VRKTKLYAWPTTNGWVCWAWAEGAGGCLHDFAHGESRTAFTGIDPDELGVGYPGTLVGVAPDDVEAAEVQVQSVRFAATVERNGIFYELPDGSCTNWVFESLTETYCGGGSHTRPDQMASRAKASQRAGSIPCWRA